MHAFSIFRVVLCSALMLLPIRLRAADASVTGSTNGPSLPIAQLLGLTGALQINPQVLSSTDDQGTTVGIRYKYDRNVMHAPLKNETKVGLQLHSEGLIVVEEKKPHNHLLTHGIRLSALNLLSAKQRVDDAERDRLERLAEKVHEQYELPWKQSLAEVQPLRAKPSASRTPEEVAKLNQLNATMMVYVEEGRKALQDYGTLEPDEEGVVPKWRLNDGNGKPVGFKEKLIARALKDPPVYLNFDFNADAETDQTFSDVQLVGNAQLRGMVLIPLLDYPFRLLRGGEDAKNPLNRNNGPYFFGGIAYVDASGNESRKELTTEHDHFARAHFDLYYRTEVFGTTAANAVALEFSWRLYHEIDAPKPIRQKNLETTSYFKATLLFPGNYFLEYTDGKLPLDVEGASTVSVGWRHNF